MIDSYSFGKIVVAGKTYTTDVIIYPDQVDSGWWRKEGHRLVLEDLAQVLAARPQVVVVGTGHSGLMRVSPEVERDLQKAGIELKVAPTSEACLIYNQLYSRKMVIAALHLTC